MFIWSSYKVDWALAYIRIFDAAKDEEQHVPLLFETPKKRGKLTALFKRAKFVESPRYPTRLLRKS